MSIKNTINEVRDKIIEYLDQRKCFVSKSKIAKETNLKLRHVTLALRELRKEKIVKLGYKRWGLTYGRK